MNIDTETHSKKIVVIGAGLAGLTAAYRLYQAGRNVEVYEARRRVGGRIFSISLNGNIAELGAQNITDGGKSTHLLKLIRELGLAVSPQRVNLKRSYFDGKEFFSFQDLLHNHSFEPNSLKLQIDQLKAKSRNMKEVLSGILKEDNPLYKAIAVGLGAYEGAPLEKLSPIYCETLFHILTRGACTDQGVKEEDFLSLLTVQGGNGLLLEKIAHTLPVHLNSPLTQISKDSQTFLLTFRNDKQVKTDILILAIPSSVYDNISFENGIIPLERLESMKSIRYGTNGKVLIPTSLQTNEGFITDHMVGFFDTPQRLTLYYTQAKDMADHQDQPLIKKILGLHYPTPILATDQSFASYSGPVGYSWPNDPYAKGSYAYVSPGQEALLTTIREENGEKMKALFAPVERLYFAGEHTSILLDVPGTMEAACESGERTARMILNR